MFNTNEILSQIQKDLGASPQHIDSEKITRFDIGKKNKAGWVRFTEWNYNGKDYAAAFYGDWRIHSDLHFITWKSWSKEEELEDKYLIKHLKIEQEQLRIKQKQEQAENLKKIQETFPTFSPVKTNEYLTRKKMTQTENLFENKKGDLILPAYKDIGRTEVFGYQTVNKSGKFFKTGSQVQSAFNYFGKINQETPVVYLCEGIATADSIYTATKIPTISCFSANNIPNVVKYFKENLSGINIVVACDVDKDQASQKFAFKAKAKFGDIIIIKPKFDKNSTLSDFNDLYVTQGLDETKKQLGFDETEFTHVEMLGFKEGKYYFYSSKTKELLDLSIDKMKAGNLIQLAPNTYWAQKFVPKLNKDGDPTSFCDWLLTTERIVFKQNQIGSFSSEKIKGVGSWIDQGKHVLNLGDKLLVDFKLRSYGKHSDLKKFYQPNPKTILEFQDKPEYDFSKLNEALSLIDFSSERDRIVVLGYIAISQIFTTQRWRPHLWITAEKGTGKSSLLEFLNMVIQNSNIYQDSTAAGLRQDIRCDSKVCIIDEAEGESNKTKQLIELARQSSSGSKTNVVRGTVTGSGFNYTPELSFLFASIRIGDLTPADQSRIIQVFMKKRKGNSSSINKKRESVMYDAEKLNVDLFSYMNKNLNLFNDLLIITKNKMKDQGLDNRFIDQMSPILTGFLMLNENADPTETAKTLLQVEELEVEEENDHQEFYDHFLSLLIREGTTELTLSQVFKKLQTEESEFWNQVLFKYGMVYSKKAQDIFISKNNNLNSLFKKQTKFQNYFLQMKNSKFFTPNRRFFGEKQLRGYIMTK